MVVKTELGNWMEDQRTSQGLTKGKLSEKIGISVGQYSSYVSGKSMPRGKTLQKIADAFGKPLAEIEEMLTPAVPVAQDAADVDEEDFEELLYEYDDALMARISLLEAKLDYAVTLLEKVVRG